MGLMVERCLQTTSLILGRQKAVSACAKEVRITPALAIGKRRRPVASR
jgi:hypothetical protein